MCSQEEAGDGFKAVLGHWIEGLIDDDDEETGEKAEQELHSKVRYDLLWTIDVVVYLIGLCSFESARVFFVYRMRRVWRRHFLHIIRS